LGVLLIGSALGADRFRLAEVVELRPAVVALVFFPEIGHRLLERRLTLARGFRGVNTSFRSDRGDRLALKKGEFMAVVRIDNLPASGPERERECCRALEKGDVLLFPTTPFRISAED